MTGFAFDYTPSNAACLRAARTGKKLLGESDARITTVFVMYLLATAVVAAVVRLVIGTSFPEGPLPDVANIAVIGLAVISWSRIGIPWVKRQWAARSQRLLPETQTHVSVSEEGIRITDSLSEVFWRWPRVHGAFPSAEGVVILSGTAVCLLPPKVIDAAQQSALINFVNERADSAFAKRRSGTGSR